MRTGTATRDERVTAELRGPPIEERSTHREGLRRILDKQVGRRVQNALDALRKHGGNATEVVRARRQLERALRTVADEHAGREAEERRNRERRTPPTAHKV